MQTNHDCYLTSLQIILGSNTVCSGLFTGLTVLILEYVQASFLLFCRGTFLFFFLFFFFCECEHALQSFTNSLGEERTPTSPPHAASTQVIQRKLKEKKHKPLFFFPLDFIFSRNNIAVVSSVSVFFFFVKIKNIGAKIRPGHTAKQSQQKGFFIIQKHNQITQSDY